MDNELFLKRLSELAELTQVKVPRTGNLREASDDNVVWRQGQPVLIDKKNNPSLSWQVKKLKTQAKTCEDCGQMVKDRRVTKSHYTFPKSHWRQQCWGCNKVKDPETGEYTVAPPLAQSRFISWFRKA
jgi:ssDNA-binding Zn-finger/Zn-ribbon topoisomerase 1